MSNHKNNHQLVRKMALIGILIALAAVLSFIKIPIMGSVSVTLVLPVVVIGSAICGPYVGALLTIIPAFVAFGESVLFMTYSPMGAILTFFLKGLLSGFVAGWIYKLISTKHPIGAVTCSAVVAPIINTGIFLLGCYIFIWNALMETATKANIGIGTLLFGLAGMNFIVELLLNIILCPTILRIIQVFQKNYTVQN